MEFQFPLADNGTSCEYGTKLIIMFQMQHVNTIKLVPNYVLQYHTAKGCINRWFSKRRNESIGR